MEILGYILFGFIIGLIARAVMPGRDSMGIIATTLVGMAGALLGGWLGGALGLYDRTEGVGFIGAIIGAIVVLFIYNKAMRGRVGRRGPSGTIGGSDRDKWAA